MIAGFGLLSGHIVLAGFAGLRVMSAASIHLLKLYMHTCSVWRRYTYNIELKNHDD